MNLELENTSQLYIELKPDTGKRKLLMLTEKGTTFCQKHIYPYIEANKRAYAAHQDLPISKLFVGYDDELCKMTYGLLL